MKHLLVILDACHSGIALDTVIWRDAGLGSDGAIEPLRARRSRRIITSALHGQRALDSGPVPGHSLFTGCVIEAWIDGPILGADNRFAAPGPAKIDRIQSAYSVWIEKSLGFRCGLEFDQAGDPVALPRCSAASPIWHATPARIPLVCVTDRPGRRVRCAGIYTLREDDVHGSSAEFALQRELRLDEVIHGAWGSEP